MIWTLLQIFWLHSIGDNDEWKCVSGKNSLPTKYNNHKMTLLYHYEANKIDLRCISIQHADHFIVVW